MFGIKVGQKNSDLHEIVTSTTLLWNHAVMEIFQEAMSQGMITKLFRAFSAFSATI